MLTLILNGVNMSIGIIKELKIATSCCSLRASFTTKHFHSVNKKLSKDFGGMHKTKSCDMSIDIDIDIYGYEKALQSAKGN